MRRGSTSANSTSAAPDSSSRSRNQDRSRDRPPMIASHCHCRRVAQRARYALFHHSVWYVNGILGSCVVALPHTGRKRRKKWNPRAWSPGVRFRMSGRGRSVAGRQATWGASSGGGAGLVRGGSVVESDVQNPEFMSLTGIKSSRDTPDHRKEGGPFGSAAVGRPGRAIVVERSDRPRPLRHPGRNRRALIAGLPGFMESS